MPKGEQTLAPKYLTHKKIIILELFNIIEKRVRSWFIMEKYSRIVPVEPEMNSEMMLDKALRDYRKGQIEKAIDHALENRNKDEFLRLTEEFKNID